MADVRKKYRDLKIKYSEALAEIERLKAPVVKKKAVVKKKVATKKKVVRKKATPKKAA